MPNCPEYVLWRKVPPNSTLMGQATASSDADYSAMVDGSFNDGGSFSWSKSDLVAGASFVMKLPSGTVRPAVTVVSGSVTLNLWIASNGLKIQQCIWTYGADGVPHALVVDILPN